MTCARSCSLASTEGRSALFNTAAEYSLNAALLQHFFPAHGIDKGNFQPCQLNVGRDEVYTLCMVQHTFTGRNALVVHGFCHQGRKSGGQFIGLLPAHTDGERTLWVSIHQ